MENLPYGLSIVRIATLSRNVLAWSELFKVRIGNYLARLDPSASFTGVQPMTDLKSGKITR